MKVKFQFLKFATQCSKYPCINVRCIRVRITWGEKFLISEKLQSIITLSTKFMKGTLSPNMPSSSKSRLGTDIHRFFHLLDNMLWQHLSLGGKRITSGIFLIKFLPSSVSNSFPLLFPASGFCHRLLEHLHPWFCWLTKVDKIRSLERSPEIISNS